MTLRLRMQLLALLPAALVAVLLTGLFLWVAIDNLEQGLRTRGAAISRQMATAAEFGLFSGQRASLSALTESAQRIDSEVSGAAILDVKGTVMARSGEIHSAEWLEFRRIEGRLGRDVMLFVEPVMRSSLPVDDIYSGGDFFPSAGPKVLGHAVVELSLRETAAKGKWLIAIGVLIALLGAALGAWLAQRIARAVTAPLMEASEVVARIGRGDLAARMTAESAGALEALATGINQMAVRIGQTQEDLRARVAEATQDLLREKEAAEHATIAKSHFLASASHDLRQPLHALGLLVSSLARSEAAKLEPKLVGHIQSAADALQNLLDDILDISQLDGGNLVPRLSSFPLSHVFDRLTPGLLLLARQKGLRLKVRPTRLWVRGDQQIIERILLNLVGNALRYTRAGGVLVSCRRPRDGMVRIEIWDTGAGIADKAREEIFEDYVQLGNPERDQAKGLGLGLAICRRLADLLAVPLGVRSRLGRGSVFWMGLPVVPTGVSADAPAPGLVHAGQEPDAALLSGTVLVVEGDVLVRAGMAQAITGWGARVLLADNREDALRLCRDSAHPPDLTICNIRLGGLVGGLELAQELRREFAGMGLLLVSADASDAARSAARRAGFALLKEPVPPGRLRAALQQLLADR